MSGKAYLFLLIYHSQGRLHPASRLCCRSIKSWESVNSSGSWSRPPITRGALPSSTLGTVKGAAKACCCLLLWRGILKQVPYHGRLQPRPQGAVLSRWWAATDILSWRWNNSVNNSGSRAPWSLTPAETSPLFRCEAVQLESRGQTSASLRMQLFCNDYGKVLLSKMAGKLPAHSSSVFLILM